MKKKILVIVIVLAVFFAYAVYHAETTKTLVYRDSLDKTAVTVDGEKMTLEDLAFYVAYEEITVEEQAEIYMPEDTNAYWNLHIDGEFMKVAAKEAAMDMAVHDRIFYNYAVEQGLQLNEEEQELMSTSLRDFLTSMTTEQKELLGVSEEKLQEIFREMALAQKYQNMLSQQEGRDYAVYDIAGTGYEEIKKEHKIKIKNSVWERIDFGNIVVPHS